MSHRNTHGQGLSERIRTTPHLSNEEKLTLTILTDNSGLTPKEIMLRLARRMSQIDIYNSINSLNNKGLLEIYYISQLGEVQLTFATDWVLKI